MNEDTPRRLLTMLKERHLTIATAESCTGGNIAHCLTLIPGASDAVRGGVVAYCNEVKHEILGVENNLFETVGAVSEEVVKQMAEGARRRLKADIGVATSGIAGPGGAVPGKPVGTVCYAVAMPGKTVTRRTIFPGTRSDVIDAATEAVLRLALEQIL